MASLVPSTEVQRTKRKPVFLAHLFAPGPPLGLCTLYSQLCTFVAGTTGLEPAASCVTGRRSKPTELRPHVPSEYKGSEYQVQRPNRHLVFLFVLGTQVLCTSGGRRGTRTPDIFLVREALSQLSYSPVASDKTKAGLKYSNNTSCCQAKNRRFHLFWAPGTTFEHSSISSASRNVNLSTDWMAESVENGV